VNEDEIRARLHSLADEPIDAATRDRHLRRMAAAGLDAEPRRRGFVWAGIAAAAVVGFLAGSTGLAMADALPDPAQSVAHDVLGAVRVDVPQGNQGTRGACVSEAAKIKDKDAKRAAKEACPKGGGDESGDDQTGVDETGDGNDSPNTPGGPPASDDPCHGRPPWAGPMSKEQREAAKASASRANCPKDDSDGDDEDSNHGDTNESSGDGTEDDATAPAPTASTTTSTTTAAPTGSSTDESSSGG